MDVWYDSAGIVRNIGPWDYAPKFDEEGVAYHANPLPPDHYCVDEEVGTNADGSRYVIPRTGD